MTNCFVHPGLTPVIGIQYFCKMTTGMLRHILVFNALKFSDLLPANFYIPD